MGGGQFWASPPLAIFMELAQNHDPKKAYKTGLLRVSFITRHAMTEGNDDQEPTPIEQRGWAQQRSILN